MAKRVGFVAGGTGITPMISIIRWILTNRVDADLFLIFANKTEVDIIFREEWQRAMREHQNFHCYHVLEQPPVGWAEGIGRITVASYAGICLLPIPTPVFSSVARHRWSMPWNPHSKSSAIQSRPSSSRESTKEES